LRPPPREGDVWDGFVIGRRLYQGRYTVVHLAQDTIEQRELVLKIPLPGIVADQVFRAGFLRESWIGTRINSPYVARYVALAPGRQTALYLAMPFYQGQTLEQRLATPPSVDLLEGLEIARKLCHAITDLGRLQVIHRDIKPENILLLSDGDLRLLDLGIAYLPGIDLAAQSGLGGTTRYMAPELFKTAATSEQTEVFSLAITLYRMWSGGKFPFGQHEAYPLARLRPDLPAWLGHCLARALAPEPAKRFDTAANFAAALDAQLMLGEFSPASARGLKLLYWQIAAVILALVNLVLLAILAHGR
jgi:serine/threonine protein kinase